MPHADTTTFSPLSTKPQIYAALYASLDALVAGQRNWVANTANAASLLWHAFVALDAHVNWSGFYVYDKAASRAKREMLVLGPFQGKVACQAIPFGVGVCGAAAAGGRSVRVDDVEQFPGHIACDSASKSEIVVPIVVGGKTAAIIDVDCEQLNGFDDVDQEWLEKVAELLGKSCDW